MPLKKVLRKASKERLNIFKTFLFMEIKNFIFDREYLFREPKKLTLEEGEKRD